MGLVALKNFLEEGFDAVAFEKNDYIGGIWQFTNDKETTSGTESEFCPKHHSHLVGDLLKFIETKWNSCRQMVGHCLGEILIVVDLIEVHSHAIQTFLSLQTILTFQT